MHDFVAKRNALFACLDDASHELKGTTLDQTKSQSAFKRTSYGDLEMTYRQQHNKNKHPEAAKGLHHLRGKESIFKKPELPIARCLKPRKLPDYKINPHKWKKYSLEDVDISDQTNSTAAFEFLRQIDEQKESINASSIDSPEKLEGVTKKIEFKKSSKIRRNMKSLESMEQHDVEIDSPKLKGSKVVMAEYVVGQNKMSINKKKLIVFSSGNDKQERAAGKLMLSHLQEEHDEDEN